MAATEEFQGLPEEIKDRYAATKKEFPAMPK